jgi:hypothetical protein
MQISKYGGLPLAGSHCQLDASHVRQVCETLGPEEQELPGPEGRV